MLHMSLHFGLKRAIVGPHSGVDSMRGLVLTEAGKTDKETGNDDSITNTFKNDGSAQLFALV